MKKFAIVGAGFRCYHMFAKTIRDRFSDRCKLIGVCDPDYKRARIYIDTIDKDMKYYADCTVYCDSDSASLLTDELIKKYS